MWQDIGVGVLENAYNGLFPDLVGVHACPNRVRLHCGPGYVHFDGHLKAADALSSTPEAPTIHPSYLYAPRLYNAGYNCSLFAYGQTGSGKSYSMMGLVLSWLATRIAAQDVIHAW